MSSVQIATISLEEVSLNNDLFIDVRSPAEFEEYSLPNAVNIPLFTNEERARVGTTYKQKSREEAMELGLSIFAPKWPDFYRRVLELHKQSPEQRIVIYCWRGGMRSKSFVTSLGLMNVPCYQLEGGIRTFRRYVQKELAKEANTRRSFVVISGHTGTRKTELLKELQEKGFPVLDLEGLAGHRGSIFGHIGEQPRSQKQFEYLLLRRMQELSNQKTLIIEAESKRIGHIIIPDFILEGKQNGIRIELEYPFWGRVDHIYRTYQPEKHADEIYEAMSFLQKWLAKDIFDEMKQLWNKQEYKQVFALLLEHYYDPRYNHTHKQYKDKAIPLYYETFDEGYENLCKLLSDLLMKQEEY